jgi:glutathione S-transferase
MKLYDSTIAPNPRRVRIFAAEKGIDLPLEQVDLQGGANRKEPFLSKNPMGGLPVLELDDGRCLSESLVICEYLEDLHPDPALIGSTPDERAFARMWERRMEIEVMYPMLSAFRHGSAFFKGRITQVPEMVEPSRAAAAKRLAWVDGLLSSQEYVAGDRFTIADITLFCTIDFAGMVGEKYDPALKNLAAWHERMRARPSATA